MIALRIENYIPGKEIIFKVFYFAPNFKLETSNSKLNACVKNQKANNLESGVGLILMENDFLVPEELSCYN